MSKTLLIYRLGSIGDTVVALPCFHALARAFPQDRRIALTNIPVSGATSSLADVLGGSGLIHGELAYPVGTRSPLALLRLRRDIRATGADRVIYLMPERSPSALRRDLLFLKACGLDDAIGASPQTLRLRRLDERTGEVERECARLARSLAKLGPIDLDAPASWDLMLTPSERESARKLLPDGLFLAINMGGKLARNDWGADKWTALLQTLSRLHPALGLVIVGGAGDRERAECARLAWSGSTLNLCGELSVRETAAALERAALFIGHDSGPMHLAAAVRVPLVALFGDNNPPKKWHPIGARQICLHDMCGVRRIAIDEALSSVEKLLIETVASHCRVSGKLCGTAGEKSDHR
jgi:ADP-heptose:LPS heptosyltransferase